jgi:hypothetical protein
VFDRQTATVRCCGLEMNVKKKKTENLEKSIPSRDYDRSKTVGEFGMFQLFG